MKQRRGQPEGCPLSVFSWKLRARAIGAGAVAGAFVQTIVLSAVVADAVVIGVDEMAAHRTAAGRNAFMLAGGVLAVIADSIAVRIDKVIANDKFCRGLRLSGGTLAGPCHGSDEENAENQSQDFDGVFGVHERSPLFPVCFDVENVTTERLLQDRFQFLEDDRQDEIIFLQSTA